MKRYLLSGTLTFIVATFVVNIVLAATLTLTSIGSLYTSGNSYSEWWYTAENPTLKGTATADAEVSIDINGTVSTTTADSQGTWILATSNLNYGDHSVKLSSSGEEYAFTLHISQTAPDSFSTTTQTTQSTVPTTGFDQIQILFISAGLVAAGFYLHKIYA